jgi:hypothetical protein
VVFARDPRRHVVLDLVDLRGEAFMLDEAAEGLGVADQPVLGHGGDEHAGAEGALVVLAGDGVHLAGALQVDVFALALVGIESVVAGHHDEARETYELTEGMEFLFGECPKWALLSLPFYISQIYTDRLKGPPNETRRSIYEG